MRYLIIIGMVGAAGFLGCTDRAGKTSTVTHKSASSDSSTVIENRPDDCFKAELKRQGLTDGGLDVSYDLQIAATGEVTAVENATFSSPHPDFHSCVLTAARGLKFPAEPTAHRVSSKYRFNAPANAAP